MIIIILSKDVLKRAISEDLKDYSMFYQKLETVYVSIIIFFFFFKKLKLCPQRSLIK